MKGKSHVPERLLATDKTDASVCLVRFAILQQNGRLPNI